MTKMNATQLIALAASNPKAFRSLARKNGMTVKTHSIEQIAANLADPNFIAADQTDDLISILTAGISTEDRAKAREELLKVTIKPSDMTELGYNVLKTLQGQLAGYRNGEPEFTDILCSEIAAAMGKKTATVKGALVHLEKAKYVFGFDGETGFDLFWGLTTKGWEVE